MRAVTFYVYIDTPHRFRNKAALWKYCGIGLERRHSGSGKVKVRVSQQCNRRLKNAVVGAAKTASAMVGTPYADKYQYWLETEKIASIARRNVARSMVNTLWSLWKTGDHYDPAQVIGAGLTD